jgi:general secretion pathway protein G
MPENKVAAAKTQIGNFKTALEVYYLNLGRYPTRLEALVNNPANNPRWRGPYLANTTEVPLDPWNHPYHYELLAHPKGAYRITCYGADGKPGGTGDNADLSSTHEGYEGVVARQPQE